MKIFIVHKAERDRYEPDYAQSKIYYASASRDKAEKKRKEMEASGKYWYLDISEVEVE